MRLRKQVARPQSKYTPPSKVIAVRSRPCELDSCPSCKGPKAKKCKLCQQCRIKSNKPPPDPVVYIVNGIRCRRVAMSRQLYTLVDEADYEGLVQYNWHGRRSSKDHTTYAYAVVRVHDVIKTISMHRMLLDIHDKGTGRKVVHHKNHDGLDNRTNNITACSQSQNASHKTPIIKSSSGFVGVYWNKNENKWKAGLKVEGRQIHLGYFDDKMEAVRVRDAAALKHRGEFAWLNFPSASHANSTQQENRTPARKQDYPVGLQSE